MRKGARDQDVNLIQSVKPALIDHHGDEREPTRVPISCDLLNRACSRVGDKVETVPFGWRGIRITRRLIRVAMGILNAEPAKTLPQNCRNAARKNTPDGLDKRIKEALDSDLRTANIISDVLEQAGIAKVVRVTNRETGRLVKGTRLLRKWTW